MPDRQIKDIHFLEDSDDEVFISRLKLKSQKVDIHLHHYGSPADLKKAISVPSGDLPVVVFIDFNLPGMKGTEVIADILKHNAGDKIIIGICSGSEDPADRRHAREVGARFFVGKPLDRKALENVCEIIQELTIRQNEDKTFSLHAV